MRSISLVGVLVGCLVLAVAVIEVGSGSGGREGVARQSHGGRLGESGTPWTDLLKLASQRRSLSRREITSAYAVLHSSPEPVPARMAAHIEKTLGAPPGSFQIEEAQYASTRGGSVWVLIGSRNIMCLVQAGRGALICAPASIAVRRGLSIGLFAVPRRPGQRPHNYLLLGIAPDWVRNVQLRVANAAQSVAVRRNTYALRANAPILIERFCGVAHQRCKTPAQREGLGS